MSAKTKKLDGYICSFLDGEPVSADDGCAIIYKTLPKLRKAIGVLERICGGHRYHKITGGAVNLKGKFLTPLNKISKKSRDEERARRAGARPLKI